MRLLSLLIALLILFAGCQPETRRIDGYEVHGIDVSHYQSHIDWDRVAAQEVDFVFIKATEGASLADTLFCRNWESIRQTPMKRGAYHFFRPTVRAADQVRNFAEVVNLMAGDLPPVLDVEVLDGVAPAILLEGVKTWLLRIEEAYGIRPIIYTNQKFYHRFLAGHFPAYPLWIARYHSVPPMLRNGEEWVFWQYGNRGQLPGIDGPVDFNVFRGRLADLNTLCVVPLRPLSDLGTDPVLRFSFPIR